MTGTLEEVADGVLAFTADGDPNVGAVIGERGVVCVDARATPAAARPWLAELRAVTDRPIRYLVLTHYHAVRVLGASALQAGEVVASAQTTALIRERGAADWESEFARFPQLAPDPHEVPGLTWPTIVLDGPVTLDLGDREVHVTFAGRGHTAGDTVLWVPDCGVLFAGDLVERDATPYAGDAYIREWSTSTLDRVQEFDAAALVPGRGPHVRGDDVAASIEATRAYLAGLLESVEGHDDFLGALSAARAQLEPRFGEWTIFHHCLPFNVKRVLGERAGQEPEIWTAEADTALREFAATVMS